MKRFFLKKTCEIIAVAMMVFISMSAMAAQWVKVTDTMWYRVNYQEFEASSWEEICDSYAEKYFIPGESCIADGSNCPVFTGTVLHAGGGGSVVCTGKSRSTGKEMNYPVNSVFCKIGRSITPSSGNTVADFGCFELR